MNNFAAYLREVHGGWWVMLRFARNARPSPILSKGGVPIIYTSELHATNEALQHVLAYMNGNYLREGETMSITPTEREKVFGADGTIYRNGKAIKVERKRAAA